MMEQKKVFVIGPGRWGTFIAWYLDRAGQDVTLYGRESSKNMKELMETRKNKYLTLSDSMSLTITYEGIFEADYLVISVAAQGLQNLVSQLNEMGIREKTIILCMKGIEIATGRRLSQIASDTLDESNRVAVWLGPGHVQDFYRGVPNCMVIDSTDESIKRELVQNFSSDLIRFYYGTDLIGNEVGAAAKNVVGIAAGMLEGLDLFSLKGALMARGTHEISKLIVAMGGKENSVYGLCHLGDYEATLFSPFSHNLTYGKHLVQGTEYDELAEGCYTVEALCKLGKEYHVELPICEAVHKIIYEGANAKSTLDELFRRSVKNEFS